MARSAITTPSGWTKLVETAQFDDGAIFQRVAVFSKTTVTSSDSSQSITWTQASSARMAVTYAVLSGVGSLEDSDTATLNSQPEGTWSITPPSISATQNGSMFMCFASTIDGESLGMTPVAPSGFTLFSGYNLGTLRLSGAYKAANNGDSISGAFNLDDAPPSGLGTNALGAVSLLFAPESASAVEGRSSAPTMLGAALAQGSSRREGAVVVPSPLSTLLVFAQHDFTALVNSASQVYVMDLFTTDGVVRVPISSWQATLQVDVDSYLQAVVPACSQWVDTLEAATDFAISRLAASLDGLVQAEVLVAKAPISHVSLAQGSRNYSATVSGYWAGYTYVENPPASLDRALTGVQSVFTDASGLRVRCSIDWLLRPAQRAYLGTTPLLVGYMNLYATGSEAYMDVGESRD
jgi:hypothetical protein